MSDEVSKERIHSKSSNYWEGNLAVCDFFSFFIFLSKPLLIMLFVSQVANLNMHFTFFWFKSMVIVNNWQISRHYNVTV